MKYIILAYFLLLFFSSICQNKITLYEKLYSSWKILDSSNTIVPYETWNQKVTSGHYILADHPYNALKKDKKDTSIKQLIALDDETIFKRQAYKNTQLANITLNIKGQMPRFTITDSKDSIFNNNTLLGKPYVLYIGCFTNCTESIWELAEADKLYRIYKDSGVVFLAINYDKKMPNLNNLTRKNNLCLPMANSNNDFQEIIELLGDIPMHIVVNKLGQIVHKTNTYSHTENGDESLYAYAVRGALRKCLE
jgi:peroxiredoxin